MVTRKSHKTPQHWKRMLSHTLHLLQSNYSSRDESWLPSRPDVVLFFFFFPPQEYIIESPAPPPGRASSPPPATSSSAPGGWTRSASPAATPRSATGPRGSGPSPRRPCRTSAPAGLSSSSSPFSQPYWRRRSQHVSSVIFRKLGERLLVERDEG